MNVYGLLLHLYPASFRNEYGAEMRAVFERRRGQTSGAGALALWLATIGETIVNAAAVHFDILRQDLSYTARMLRRTPGFALTAVVIVALGIGATTAAFSVTDFVLIRPLPFADPERLVNIWERTPGTAHMTCRRPISATGLAMRRCSSALAMITMRPRTLLGAGDPVRVEGSVALARADADAWRVSRSSDACSRRPTTSRGAAGTMILSYRALADAVWRRSVGHRTAGPARRRAVHRHRRDGAASSAFHRPTPRSGLRCGSTNRTTQDRNDNWLYAVGRLQPGVTLAQARAEMDVIARAVAAAVSRTRTRTSALRSSGFQRRGARSSRGCC